MSPWGISALYLYMTAYMDDLADDEDLNQDPVAILAGGLHEAIIVLSESFDCNEETRTAIANTLLTAVMAGMYSRGHAVLPVMGTADMLYAADQVNAIALGLEPDDVETFNRKREDDKDG